MGLAHSQPTLLHPPIICYTLMKLEFSVAVRHAGALVASATVHHAGAAMHVLFID